MKNVKIIQIIATENSNMWQGCLLGLGDDGVVYIESYRNKEVSWNVYLPLKFKDDKEQ